MSLVDGKINFTIFYSRVDKLRIRYVGESEHSNRSQKIGVLGISC